MATETLEEMINAYHIHVAPNFIAQLLRLKKIPGIDTRGVYYLKDDAAIGITSRLADDGVQIPCQSDFSKLLYGSINKTPLKHVGYGMLNATLPKEVAHVITPWEAIYAYAGIWNRKAATVPRYQFQQDALQNQTLYQIVRDIIFRGMDKIKYIHNKEHNDGNYKHHMEKVPHQDEVEERFSYARITLHQLEKLHKKGLLGQARLF